MVSEITQFLTYISLHPITQITAFLVFFTAMYYRYLKPIIYRIFKKELSEIPVNPLSKRINKFKELFKSTKIGFLMEIIITMLFIANLYVMWDYKEAYSGAVQEQVVLCPNNLWNGTAWNLNITFNNNPKNSINFDRPSG